MRSVALRIFAGVGLWLSCIFPTQAAAEEVTIAKLLSGAPVLSPENERLHSFRFTYTTRLPFDVPLTSRCAWARPDTYGFLLTAGEEETPVLFLAEKKTLLFDAGARSLLLGDDSGPRFVLAATATGINIQTGLAAQSQAEVKIDFPSLLAGSVERGKLLKTADGNWQLTTLSESGNSQVVALFAGTAGHPLLSLEVNSAKENRQLFAVREISINQPADARWQPFPADEAFPAGLTLTHLADLKINAAADGVNQVTQHLRAISVQCGLRKPDQRGMPLLGDIDWDAVARANKDLGPPLHKLLTKSIEARK